MGKRIRKWLVDVVLLVVAAFLYTFAFPSYVNSEGWGFLAAFALIPVFFVINRSSLKIVWMHGAFFGFLYYVLYNYWLKTFHPLAILIAPILKLVQFIPLFLFLGLCPRLFGKRSYLMQGFVWCAYSYLTQQGFLAYPYGNIASAFYKYLPLLQIASITGIWGIVMMAIIPQTFVAMLWKTRRRLGEYRVDVLVYLGLFVLQLAFGFCSLAYYRNAPGERTVRIAAVQHSADSWKGGYETYKRNFETLRDYSLEALEAKPDMILWSETAFVPSVSWHQEHPNNPYMSALVNDFVDFGKNLPVPLITGNPEGLVKDKNLPAFLKDGSWNWKTYNTVILFGNGKILGTYRKQHLVPFTEYFPYEKQFPRLYQLLKDNDYKWWEKGTEPVVFSYDGIDFSTPICFEDIFGSLNAEFVRNGADMLVNLTNDSWSGAVSAEMQHLCLAIFRSIENRRPMVRGTNSGITAMVLPTGEIVDPMEPFAKGWHLYEVPIGQKEGMTFYTRHPDLFAKAGIVFTVLAFAFAIVRWGKRKRLYRRYGHLFDDVGLI